MGVRQRLAELEVRLPAAATPAGSYVPAVRSGEYVFTAGALPYVGGELPATGHVGAEVSPDVAAGYARQAAINLLAAVATVADLDDVEQIVKVTGFVASAPGFTNQSVVINGASDFFVEVFGEAGRHARSAVGMAELPLGSPLEIEAVLRLRAGARQIS